MSDIFILSPEYQDGRKMCKGRKISIEGKEYRILWWWKNDYSEITGDWRSRLASLKKKTSYAAMIVDAAM
ncbi:hypothetical protein TIFTF001_023758 [Ficus carica]|uniref:Uncharacterized protein n=1 Tax=Ficus carica TaxID=3494 RepID=A0AA88AP14_FICCA|nr:hypothetical protein TIFTF001_023758 [Ficus carica]